MLQWLQGELRHSPEILIFLSLALGYWIGQFRFGKFQLGGVAGSLLVAVLLSLLGVPIDNGVKSILFALFIYAVGFESGPQFFKSLGRSTLREIVLAAFMALSGLATVLVMARLFHLDKGLAAGLAAGGLTQSAIIGTAGDALSRLGLAADDLQKLQSNVAIGYAVTYIFGSLGAIIVCVNILPRFMGREIRDDALKAEAARLKGAVVLGPGESAAAPDIVGRIYRIESAAGSTVAAVEGAHSGITIERLKRAGKLIDMAPGTALAAGDMALVVGRREAVVGAAAALGEEAPGEPGMELIMDTLDVVVRNVDFTGKPLAGLARADDTLRHGIYLLAVQRLGEPVVLNGQTVLQPGDVVTAYGTDSDLRRVAARVGGVLAASSKTDWVFHGFGLVLGLLIGLLVLRVGSIPLTLGAGGGALLSGLLFGWMRTRHQTVGNMPNGAVQLLKDLGLAGFVAAVGLQSGLQAIDTIRHSGLSLFMIGVVVTLVPLLLSMVFARYVLRYDNSAVLAGALSGARSANPAFGEVLNKAGNSVPTVPFAITYALANVFLTLLGPLVVAFA